MMSLRTFSAAVSDRVDLGDAVVEGLGGRRPDGAAGGDAHMARR